MSSYYKKNPWQNSFKINNILPTL